MHFSSLTFLAVYLRYFIFSTKQNAFQYYVWLAGMFPYMSRLQHCFHVLFGLQEYASIHVWLAKIFPYIMFVLQECLKNLYLSWICWVRLAQMLPNIKFGLQYCFPILRLLSGNFPLYVWLAGMFSYIVCCRGTDEYKCTNDVPRVPSEYRV